MNPPTPLEDRIRRGLQDAAAAIPPPDPHRPSPRPRPAAANRRWTFRLAAGAAAAAAVVAAVVFVAGGDGDGDSSREVEVGTPDEATTSQQQAPQNLVPGRAVVVGTELRTYDAAGTQTGALSMAPLEDVQVARSDLTGGWVACGLPGQPPAAPSDEDPAAGAPTTTGPASTEGSGAAEAREAAEASRADDTFDDGPSVPASDGDRMMWFPANSEPVELEAPGLFCVADAVRVVDTPEGPTAIYESMGTGNPVGSGLGAVVLATGEHREIALPADVDPNDFYRWAATSNRVVLHGTDTGLVVFDWTTGEIVPTAAIDPGDPSDVALSNDGTSMAVIVGDVAGPSDLVIYDLATGAERFRETFPTLATEGAQLSYDGTVVAVGNYYDGYDDVVYPPVTVIDLTTGARHTIDVYGVLP